MIMLSLPNHILISNNILLIIGNESKSMVSIDFKVSLLCGNPPSKLLFNHVKAIIHCWRASSIWVLHHIIIVRLLCVIIDHILGCRQEHVNHRTVATATTYNYLGMRCIIGMIGMINDVNYCWVVECHCPLYTSTSSVIIDEWGNIPGVWPTICIRLL